MGYGYLPYGPVGTERVNGHDIAVGDVIEHEGRIARVQQITGDDETLVFTVRTIAGAIGHRTLTGPATARLDRYPDSEHYPVCHHCGGPWPCQSLRLDAEVSALQARAARYGIPGVCPACQEPVTNHQTSQTWPGNLHGPDRTQPVTFHLRRKCMTEAIDYDQMWRDAGNTSLLGFRR